MKEKLIHLKKKYKNNYTKVKIYKTYKNEVRELTLFLDNGVTEAERIFCIINNIKKYKKCLSCGNNIKKFYKNFGYRDYCCLKCSFKNRKQNITEETIRKRKKSRFINRKEKLIKFNQIYNNKNYTLLSKNELIISLNRKINKNNIFYIDQLIEYKDLICSLIYYTKDIKFYINEQITDLQLPFRIDCILQNKSPLCECGNIRTYYENHISNFCLKCSYIDGRVDNEKNRIISFNNMKNKAKEFGYELLTLENNYLIRKYLKFKHNECNKTFTHYTQGSCTFNLYEDYPEMFCPFCSRGKSRFEKEIINFIQKHIKNEIIQNSRPLTLSNGHKREIDILIPTLNFGIEFDGIYWHSELSGKNRNYHLNKTKLSEDIGIQLIHIFENEWVLKKDIVKSVILSKLGIYKTRIYARKCKIKEIDAKTKNKFLDENHLQGQDKSKHKIGLFYENELISVMTFGKRKITGGKSQTELIRFCSKLNTQILGGANKLFSYYLKNFHDNSKIVTYADRRYSNGNFYEKLGFNFDHISHPNYWYFHIRDIYNLLHRVGFQKHKLKNILDNFDETLSEWENMQNNDYDRIWDCGNYVFVME
jgi:hypothetical protein